MAVAKTRKVKGMSKEQSENFRQNKQHSWLSPICIGQALGVGKKHTKGGAKAFSHGLSLPRACAHSLSLFLSLSLSFSLPTHSSTLFSSSLGFSCYLLNKMEL